MLIINNRFLSLYDYNFLLVIEKIFSVNSKICGSRILIINLISKVLLLYQLYHLEFLFSSLYPCLVATETQFLPGKKLAPSAGKVHKLVLAGCYLYKPLPAR